MKMIISPAKKMRVDNDIIVPWTQPAFLAKAEEIMHWMQKLGFSEAKALWGCSDGPLSCKYYKMGPARAVLYYQMSGLKDDGCLDEICVEYRYSEDE